METGLANFRTTKFFGAHHIISALVISALMVLAIPVLAEPTDELSQTAFAYFNAGRYKESYPLFLRMVKRDGSDLRAKYYLALVCQKTGQAHNAIQMYVQIVSIAPNSNEAKYSKVALNILAHRKTLPPIIHASGSMSSLDSSSGTSKGTSKAGSTGSSTGASTSTNAAATGTVPDRDMRAAEAQSAELLANAKRQADALDAKADAIEKDMASVLKPKGNGPAFTRADIDAETADMRKQSVDIRARGQRESDDVLNRANLRQQASGHH